MARDGSTGRRTRRAPGDAEAGQTHEARGEASGDAGAGKARGAADVEAALDELYGTPPAAFVTRRTELAAAARQDGRADDARRIRAARRPTLAAWAANLLLRREPGESRAFLELGEALREAYRGLDADAIDALSEQRRRVVSALTAQAVRHARDAGQPVSDTVRQDIESTLRAVLADADAADQWAAGRLRAALTPPSDFTAAAAPPPRARRRPPPPTPAPARQEDELAERRRRRQERLEQARAAAEEAERRLDAVHAGQRDTDTALERARRGEERVRRRLAEAERESADAEERLRRAQEAYDGARDALTEAQERLRQAERETRDAERRGRAAAEAVTRAEREAREAAQVVKRLEGRGSRA
ncbi:hypothetical protein ACFQE4_00815 [Streptomyces thermocoprophilus]|jgi:hypothetical protein|uniref:Uncharacterized protein n=1 Tax=Streptomyces thermocoprophilus TaxID=78356 RepID=A0ABV5VLH8_9ACTN